MLKMSYFLNNNTICALATPQGASSALGIIRLSGPQAHQILTKIFRTTAPTLLPRCIYFGTIYDGERIIDEVLVHIAAAPSSFTGEDTAEINCHGSPYIIQEIVRLAMAAGASPASPGEFTQRAFLNGKIDLAQAEAVADIIASENEAAHRLAMLQMRGGFSREISNLRSALVDFASLLELELDFSDEDVTFADRPRLLNLLEQTLQTIESLCASFSLGNVIKNGVPVAIVGATNVGKSTLLNALLGEERAIVSDIHGTTRDTIEEEITLEGIRFRFIDTAGLRDTIEEIEQLGVMRSYQKIQSASLLLLVLDASKPECFREQMQHVATKIDSSTQQVIVVLNKSDICTDNNIVNNISDILKEENISFYSISTISAKQKVGIDSLKSILAATIRSRFDDAKHSHSSIIISNLRHLHALQEAQKALRCVHESLTTIIPTDLITQDLRLALYELGKITGDIATDEILGNIFAKFCIGK